MEIVAARQTSTAKAASRATRIGQAIQLIERLRKEALLLEGKFAEALKKVAPPLRDSASNLMHYLAVRQSDNRNLQRELGKLGLSSLGRTESHVMTSLTDVLRALYLIDGQAVPKKAKKSAPVTFDGGEAVLAEHAASILGTAAGNRKTRVMVTMPGEAADDPAFIADLLAQGMNIMRINCAHDDQQVWARIIEHLRAAEKKLGLSCKISFDLAGPKLRTGAISPGESVVKWRPARNTLGQVTAPAMIWLVEESPGENLPGTGTVIPIQGKLLAKVRVGDFVKFIDARGKARALEVVEVGQGACACHADSTAYVTPGIELKLNRKGKNLATATIGSLPPLPQAILLRPGDLLDLVRGDTPGRAAITNLANLANSANSANSAGKVIKPALVACALAEVFRSVRGGEKIFFDDGRIAGTILSVTDNRIRIQITRAVGGCAKLQGEKGINLPDSALKLPAMTAKDLEDLAFAVRHADMVAMSFVQRVGDVEELIAALERLDAAHLGIILKIETKQAFNRLPSLLLCAMRHYPVAVMVARGDLGVEVGFERLSEVQEEILWLCEAAHVPVIWATQVLESLAKGGMPSRAEVTDAAMGSRAECVMLNKGPYILETLRFLCDVLNRMEAHHKKKTAMLRKLSISDLR